MGHITNPLIPLFCAQFFVFGKIFIIYLFKCGGEMFNNQRSRENNGKTMGLVVDGFPSIHIDDDDGLPRFSLRSVYLSAPSCQQIIKQT